MAKKTVAVLPVQYHPEFKGEIAITQMIVDVNTQDDRLESINCFNDIRLSGSIRSIDHSRAQTLVIFAACFPG